MKLKTPVSDYKIIWYQLAVTLYYRDDIKPLSEFEFRKYADVPQSEPAIASLDNPPFG